MVGEDGSPNTNHLVRKLRGSSGDAPAILVIKKPEHCFGLFFCQKTKFSQTRLELATCREFAGPRKHASGMFQLLEEHENTILCRTEVGPASLFLEKLIFLKI